MLPVKHGDESHEMPQELAHSYALSTRSCQDHNVKVLTRNRLGVAAIILIDHGRPLNSRDRPNYGYGRRTCKVHCIRSIFPPCLHDEPLKLIVTRLPKTFDVIAHQLSRLYG